MVEYRKVKTLEGLKKDPTQGTAKKIPETFAAVQIHDDKDVTVTVTPQSALTADCWLVQFNGFKSCADCEEYLKPNCGGGATLAKMIIDHFKDSLMTKWEFNKYFGDKSIDEDPTFHGWLKYAKDKYAFRYSFNKYKRHIKQLRIMADEPEGPDLDALYPFFSHYKQPNNRTAQQSGYHQHTQCECALTTKKGSYRDVVIEQYNEIGALIRTLYYYHQHCVAVREKGTIWLNSAGFRTTTTKQRINGYLRDWSLYSDKQVWYLVKRQWTQTGSKIIEGPIRFYDGVKLEDI